MELSKRLALKQKCNLLMNSFDMIWLKLNPILLINPALRILFQTIILTND